MRSPYARNGDMRCVPEQPSVDNGWTNRGTPLLRAARRHHRGVGTLYCTRTPSSSRNATGSGQGAPGGQEEKETTFCTPVPLGIEPCLDPCRPRLPFPALGLLTPVLDCPSPRQPLCFHCRHVYKYPSFSPRLSTASLIFSRQYQHPSTSTAPLLPVFHSTSLHPVFIYL